MSDGIDRRSFFKIVGVSGAAAAAAAGCGKTTEAILPYVVPPQHIVPGVATYYATVCRECPGGCGVLARNRDGHVVKLEGNPDHPVSRGALCARGQASLLGTYDPERIASPQLREGSERKPIPLVDAEKLVLEQPEAQFAFVVFVGARAHHVPDVLMAGPGDAAGIARHNVFQELREAARPMRCAVILAERNQ